MSTYLAYSYSSCLTEEEKNKINERVNKSQEQFYKGFNKGFKVSLMVYSIYSLTTTVAHTSDQCPTNDTTSTPAKANPSLPGKEVVKPKPVPPRASGDFVLGVMFAILLIGIGIINNRPN